jgi:GDPmannose 4,6-dehydratase
MNALIFGANGQDGTYLADACRSKNIDPVGISRSGDATHGDVSDFAFVERCVGEYAPDYIFHLAANSTTGHDALFENHATISTGTLNLLEAVHRLRLPARVFITGSAVQFRNDGTPISEKTPFEASSPYSVARIQSVYAARYYRTLGVKAYVGYFFHHESPLRKPRHLSQRIVQAAKRIKSGSDELLEVGDLSVEKEWTFAGDIAGAVLTLVGQDAVSEAVIGSGEPHSIQEWVECCFASLGLEWRKHVRGIPGYRAEFRRLVSDPRLIRSLGWKPSVGFSELCTMMIEGSSPS